MSQPLKVGIVGLGKMGRIRAETIRDNDRTVLVSVTDPAPPDRGFDNVRILPDYRAVMQQQGDNNGNQKLET